MSDVVEKTLSALPSLLSLESQSGANKLSPTSKLGHLVRSITELTSKNEEEKLIIKELAAVKEQISSPNTTMRQMRELMVRAMYCEMLGYEASFAYIHAIKLAQQGTVLEKRVGYLAVSLFLNESHELLLLLVNTVLKDLQSTNLIEVCMALTVVSQIFPKDMIPSILPLVEEKLSHQKEIIRRKAVLALYKFYLIAPNQVQHIHSKFRKALCDKDPGVMMSALHIYLQMIKENPDNYKELTSSFVTILRQVVGGKLPLDFNYHGVPAPWLQIQLLRILSLLGKEDQSTSELMYEVLDETLRRAEMNHNITYAILYECVKAIYTVYPKAELLEKAARCIGNFVLSPKINLKYLAESVLRAVDRTAIFRERTAARTFSCLFVSLEAMARPLLKIQRYFRRKPVRFFSFILLYLTAGSLVFLHSGFAGDSGSSGGRGPLASVGGGMATSAEGLGIVRRAFSDIRTTRRLGLTWTKARTREKEPEEGRGRVT
ncbi:AP-4 complex subunit epsilon-1 isoform X2 [Tachysurus ichikawai]